jgi:hypothetical protein
MKSSVKGLHSRIDEMVERLYTFDQGGSHQKSKQYDLSAHHHGSIDSTAHQIKQSAELETRLLHIEDKLNSHVFRHATGGSHRDSATSLTAFRAESLNDFAKEVDKALKDMEDRVFRII